MVKPAHLATVLIALWTHWGPTQAQNVYRCGESYSNQPCPGATVVPIEDARSPAQRAQSKAVTQRDAKSAEVMEKERLEQEGKPAPAVIPAPKAQETPEELAIKRAMKKPEVFKAVVPRKAGDPPPKKKKRAKKKPA